MKRNKLTLLQEKFAKRKNLFLKIADDDEEAADAHLEHLSQIHAQSHKLKACLKECAEDGEEIDASVKDKIAEIAAQMEKLYEANVKEDDEDDNVDQNSNPDNKPPKSHPQYSQRDKMFRAGVRVEAFPRSKWEPKATLAKTLVDLERIIRGKYPNVEMGDVEERNTFVATSLVPYDPHTHENLPREGY